MAGGTSYPQSQGLVSQVPVSRSYIPGTSLAPSAKTQSLSHIPRHPMSSRLMPAQETYPPGPAHLGGIRGQIRKVLDEIYVKWRSQTPAMRFLIFAVCISIPGLYALVGVIKEETNSSAFVGLVMLFTAPIWLVFGLRLFMELQLWDEVSRHLRNGREHYNRLPNEEKLAIFGFGLMAVVVFVLAGIVFGSFLCDVLGIVLLVTSPCWIMFGVALCLKLPWEQVWTGRPPERRYTQTSTSSLSMFKRTSTGRTSTHTSAYTRIADRSFSGSTRTAISPDFPLPDFATESRGQRSLAPTLNRPSTTIARPFGDSSTSQSFSANRGRPVTSSDMAYRSLSSEPFLERGSRSVSPPNVDRYVHKASTSSSHVAESRIVRSGTNSTVLQNQARGDAFATVNRGRSAPAESRVLYA